MCIKKIIYSLNSIIIILFLSVADYVQGQQPQCKVLLPAIAGSYSGKCKNGLAQGSGIAQGIDHYQGQFSKGLPQGNGTYTWADGSVFEGQWFNGLKDGKGKMVIPALKGDSVITGYWKKDNYIGERLISPYKIERNLGVVRTGFRKISDEGSDVVIKFFIGGNTNQDMEGFSMAYDSGNEYKSGASIGLQSVRFPLNVKIRYRTWNLLHSSQSDVLFEFAINEPGRWEITVTN